MQYKWKQSGIPQKGWTFEKVEDREVAAFKCEMCGYPRVRYVCYLDHPNLASGLRVGQVCARKMSEEYVEHLRCEKQEARREQDRRVFCCLRHWQFTFGSS